MANELLDSLDPPIVVEPTEPANATVIWLHGLGADGHDFEPIIAQLKANVTARTRFIFPHAPQIPVSINNGFVMRAWYDITASDLRRQADESGVRASARILDAFIAQEMARGIDSRRIVVAGFSQGGAIVLHGGLRQVNPLAGIMALSTYVPIMKGAEGELTPVNRNIPLFLGHGSQDPMISLALSDDSNEFLRANGYTVELHTYAMAHSVSGEELRDIGNWLERVLA